MNRRNVLPPRSTCRIDLGHVDIAAVRELVRFVEDEVAEAVDDICVPVFFDSLRIVRSMAKDHAGTGVDHSSGLTHLVGQGKEAVLVAPMDGDDHLIAARTQRSDSWEYSVKAVIGNSRLAS